MDAPEGEEEKSRKKERRRKKDKACLRKWGDHFFGLKLASPGLLIAKHSEGPEMCRVCRRRGRRQLGMTRHGEQME